jgi:hypothetical protein
MTSTPVARDYLGKRRSPLPIFIPYGSKLNLNFNFIVIST